MYEHYVRCFPERFLSYATMLFSLLFSTVWGVSVSNDAEVCNHFAKWREMDPKYVKWFRIIQVRTRGLVHYKMFSCCCSGSFAVLVAFMSMVYLCRWFPCGLKVALTLHGSHSPFTVASHCELVINVAKILQLP